LSSISEIRAAIAAANQDVADAAGRAAAGAECFDRGGRAMATAAADSAQHFDRDVQALLAQASDLVKDAIHAATAGTSAATDYAQSL
jgi:hypothetical protein